MSIKNKEDDYSDIESNSERHDHTLNWSIIMTNSMYSVEANSQSRHIKDI